MVKVPMICPRCTMANRHGAIYCRRCGQLLASSCPRCHADVLSDADFCDRCGLGLTPNAQFIWSSGQPAQAQEANEPGGVAAPHDQPAAITPEPQPAAKRPPQASEPAEPELAQYLQQFIPKELISKLEVARASGGMVGERRVVTMLFCDVKGSTAAAESLDPEEWSEIINPSFEYMIRPVYKFEGTVARLMGDGILAFFGAPIAHEDDPQRAVRAGLAIANGFAPYREQVRAGWGIDLNVRVGINTGLVLVGEVGSDLQMEYTALGDAINLAARMEQTAQQGSVQIAENTYRRVANLFEFEDLGFVEVKGKNEPIHTYRPLWSKAQRIRVRGAGELQAPLIGRESEWSALTAAADAAARGVGQIVFLTGEAGLGKSRLIQELQNREGPVEPGCEWYETTCLSYETSQPYGLFQRLLRRVIGATANDLPDVLRELLATMVDEALPGERSEARKAFESLFGLEGLDGSPPLEGEFFKQQLFRSMQALWDRRARARPVILVLEDLHWADPASADLLRHLFPLTNEVPLMLICAMRPERGSPSWRLGRLAEEEFAHRHTRINLRPLTAEESDRMVDRLLSNMDLPQQLRARILEKTEGNPFFVEEVMRTLMEYEANRRGEGGAALPAWSDGREIDIPDTVQALLTARIDRLQEDVRHTLQLAALIGRSFYYRVLKMLASPREETHLPGHLDVLQQMDLIREAARNPELEYTFRHALTQEAAYSTMLLRQRREFHRRVAEAIESLFPDQIEEMAATLAHHFGQAQVFDKALQYHTRAGDVAYRLYAIDEAIGHYQRAIGYLDEVEAGADAVIHLYTRMGRSLELNSRFEEALRVYEQMETMAKTRSEASLELAALVAQSNVYSNVNDQSDPERGEALSKRALALAREMGDEATEAKIQSNLLNALRFSTRIAEAVAAGERSLELARKLDLAEQRAIAANDLALALVAAGQAARAREVAQEARELWRELDNRPMLADSLATASMLHAFGGDFDGAMAFSEEACRISESIQNLWGQSYCRFGIGIVYWQRGDPAGAIEALEASLRYGEQANFLVAGALARAFLARIHGRLGRFERGLELAQAAVRHAEKYVPPWRLLAVSVLAQLYFFSGDIEKAAEAIENCDEQSASAFARLLCVFQLDEPRVRLALAQGDATRAVELADEAIAKIRQYDFGMYLAEALHLRSLALLQAGETDEAYETLQTARREAEAGQARWPLWQILALQAQIEAGRGQTSAAGELRAQARQIIEHIVERAGSEENRTALLEQPEIREIVVWR